ncbi:MAG: peptidoglycan editing factor PgeF [Candidatus Caldatribacteriaceae bacterium]
MKSITIGGISFFQFERIASPFFFHVLSTKQAFFHPGQGREQERLQEILGIDNLSLPRQVHGAQWMVVEKPLGESPCVDALLTDRKGIYLGILVADCLPLLFLHPQREVFAVIHAGWRGIAQNIHLEVLRAMVKIFSTQPSELFVGIGPGIGGCCFKVGKEVAQIFASRTAKRIRQKEGRFFVDLAGILRDELVKEGVKEENIEVAGLCTVCGGDVFHSFRREREQAGRNILVAGWRKRG